MAPYSMDLKAGGARVGCWLGRRCGRREVRRQSGVGPSAGPTSARDGVPRATEADEVSAPGADRWRRSPVDDADHRATGCDADGTPRRVADHRGAGHAVADDRPL